MLTGMIAISVFGAIATIWEMQRFFGLRKSLRGQGSDTREDAALEFMQN